MNGVTVVWQMAFWPPDREFVLDVPRRAWAPKLVARLTFLELTLIERERETLVTQAPAEIEGIYPCTYPGCSRGPMQPFETAGRLANHRFAAHGIRSTNEDSIRRQERRDKARSRELGSAPEYIDRNRIRDAVATRFPIKLPPAVRSGGLDIGEREYVRRRLCQMVSSALVREISREPAEICIAIAELAASGLEPVRPKVADGRKEDLMMARLESLFTKSAIAAS